MKGKIHKSNTFNKKEDGKRNEYSIGAYAYTFEIWGFDHLKSNSMLKETIKICVHKMKTILILPLSKHKTDQKMNLGYLISNYFLFIHI